MVLVVLNWQARHLYSC
ncbi:hypothetical protein D047_4961A, partial [Vibrio parahaemolyticus VPTS-2010_2]